MPDFETPVIRVQHGTRKIDLKAAHDQQLQTQQVVADLLFSELCRA
jgi:hypothetical protein